MIVRAVQGIIGLFCATALFWVGAGGMAWWDHRPAGSPAWAHVNFLWIHWTPPLSLEARLDAILAAERAAQARAVVIAAHQTQITQTAATHDASAQAGIRVVYRTITQKVTTYVSPQVDGNFPLSWSFVRVHDAAASGVTPDRVSLPAGAVDDAASTVKPSALATVIAGNYANAAANAQQLSDLQDWVRQQQAANPGH